MSERAPLASYASGSYWDVEPGVGDDEPFKVHAFTSLFRRIASTYALSPTTYVDVGCLRGGVAEGVSTALRDAGHHLRTVKGYDVSPQVATVRRPGVEFVHGDFGSSGETADLVTLFDVLEHVLRPAEFLRTIAGQCLYLGLHIPLDDSLINGLLDRYRNRLAFPGHLVFLRPATAFNLLADSGLRVIDYEYTLGFTAPSGGATLGQRALRPLRRAIAAVSPWLASRLVGGVSLMVIAATPAGLAATPSFQQLGLDRSPPIRPVHG